MSKSSQAINEAQSTRRHVKKGLFPPLPHVAKNEEPKSKVGEDEEMESDEFDSGSDLNWI